MIAKILITLAVIGGAYLVLKARAERMHRIQSEQAEQTQSVQSDMRLAAYLFIFVMLAFSAGWLYFEWRDNYREVTVRVINTQNGESVSYQARFGDVEARSFRTLDGRTITVADTDRIELGAE